MVFSMKIYHPARCSGTFESFMSHLLRYARGRQAAKRNYFVVFPIMSKKKKKKKKRKKKKVDPVG